MRIDALSRERERERERRKRRLDHVYDDIISVENLLLSWQEFLRGKRKRKDIAKLSLHLIDNIFALHRRLSQKTYRHGSYHAFRINDPKPRNIHKADVCDRLIHHAIYRILYPYFDKKFIFDSYSCRKNKGTHRAINRFRAFGRKVSRNNARTAWMLKGDIRQFFASIDHTLLLHILERHIDDAETVGLLHNVIDSFYARENSRVGLPLGNLTSQLLINIYMNEFDQFLKRTLKVHYYIRYADDFVILHESKQCLTSLLPKISEFLETTLNLSLHPDKVFIKTLASGVDFLGWVHFPHHRVLRTTTKRRMFHKLRQNHSHASLASYRGMLSHGNTHKLLLRLYLKYPDERRKQ
ncbi:MAG: reverse transcriptase/maturase family protein [Patescibacteria group bacterium]